MTDPEPLLPCPLCGGEAGPSKSRRLIRCHRCNSVEVVRATPELAAEAWNRRVLPADAREVLETLCDKLDAITEASSGIFLLAKLHGQEYDGPTYEHELARARALLETYERGEGEGHD